MKCTIEFDGPLGLTTLSFKSLQERQHILQEVATAVRRDRFYQFPADEDGARVMLHGRRLAELAFILRTEPDEA